MRNGIVLVEVEGHNIFEGYFTIFEQPDELLVDTDRSATCCQA